MQQRKSINALTFANGSVYRRNKKIILTECAVVLGLAALGEAQDLPYTRIFALFFLLFLYRSYNKLNESSRLVHESWKRLKDGIDFRKAAQSNNITGINSYLQEYGKISVNNCGQTSNRNALHFAVTARAKKSIQFLLAIDRDLAVAGAKNNIRVPNILNHQDIQGNTPVHDAIKALSKDSRNYNILFMLLIDEEITTSKNFALKESLIDLSQVNTRINPTIRNNEGKTIMDLINEVADRDNTHYKHAQRLIEELCKLNEPVFVVNNVKP